MSSPRLLTPIPHPVTGLWCVHAYYTLCPWAADGRLLLAGADRATGRSAVLIQSPDGALLDRFGGDIADGGFWHTGRWQTWGPGDASVAWQGGTLRQPRVHRRVLAAGAESSVEGDMEGAPPHGEPIISALLGMLYAAGYSDGTMHPEQAPVPFAARDRHGLFRLDFTAGSRLLLSVAQLAEHPALRERIARLDAEQRARTGDGVTLMAYCVRWNRDGSRCLFHVGNHCVDKRRGEPRLLWLFTADADGGDVRLALDLSGERRGVHWSWRPDGKGLIGYGTDPAGGKQCLAMVEADGSGYRKVSGHASGGHPSVSPADPHLVATDEGGVPDGRVLLIDTRSDTVVGECRPPRSRAPEPPGRNPFRVCHHPAWDRDGRRFLINTLPGDDAVVCEVRL